MAKGLPEDTEITFCWICRKYHGTAESWCPGIILNKLRRILIWLFNNSFDLYIKLAAFALLCVFTLFVLALVIEIVFGLHVPWLLGGKPETPPRQLTPEEIERVRNFGR